MNAVIEFINYVHMVTLHGEVLAKIFVVCLGNRGKEISMSFKCELNFLGV